MVLQVLGITVSEEVIDATFAKRDVDQSGELDFKEVRAALNALQEAGTPLELLGHEAFLDDGHVVTKPTSWPRRDEAFLDELAAS